jgi:predicted porin
MKKELLMGTALVSTLGAASVAEAVSATYSGNHQTGIEFDSPTGGTDTNAQINDNNFTVSLSETTDGGMTISSSFKLMDENTKEDYDAGLTLAFTDGSKLDVIAAGNASGSHAVSIPGSAGAEDVANTSTNMAPTGLDFMTGSTALGVEYHTAEDFLADGLKMSFSASTDSGAAAAATYRIDSHVAIGATYVTDLGDTDLTIGAGYSAVDGAKTGTAVKDDTGGIHVGISAVTGLDFMTASTVQGVEYHTASDFLADGLKMSFSASTDSGAAATATFRTDSHIAIGATYVTDLGDTAVTLGAGYSDSDGSKTVTNPTNDMGGVHVGLSAVTGDLTVAVGFADGHKNGISDNGSDEMEGDVVKAGVKYVTGDLTFNVGIATGEATDNTIGSSGGSSDSQDVTSASVSYAVASGVTAILGYTSTESSDEGSGTDDGSAWYIGANMSF